MRGLRDKVALVTGATASMGEAIAVRLAAEGCSVLGAGRNAGRGESVAARIRMSGGNASFFRTDVSVEEDVSASVTAAVAEFGRLDVVINNAAAVEISSGGEDFPAAELPTETLEHVLRVNLFGPFWYAKYAIPEMLRVGGGAFVNVSSVGAVMGVRGTSAYVASKAALDGLTRSIAADYGSRNIRANVIYPAGVPSHRQFQQRLEAFPELYERQRILPRWGTVEDVAAMAVFLASEDSGYTTGAQFPVDGGAMLKWHSPDPSEMFRPGGVLHEDRSGVGAPRELVDPKPEQFPTMK